MGLENVKYDAFISYRHCDLDSFVSENIHKKLENFKLPKSVLKKKGLTKTKIERVFRDEAELPLSDNLSDPIMAALSNAEFLIVICTPRLPLSVWCKKEIETFVQTHDRKHVLLVLADGEPDESFPEILLYEDVVEKDLNGNEVTVRRTREPLAADCRGKNNKERLKAMDTAVVKLCAAMFNLNYDDLKQRHREQQIKKRLIFMESAIALFALFAIVCIFFTIRLHNQKEIIQDRYASLMASASEELYDSGRQMDAIFAARSVLPKNSSKYNEDAYKALIKAMGVYAPSDIYVPGQVFSLPSTIMDYRISYDSQRILLQGVNSDVYVYNMNDNSLFGFYRYFGLITDDYDEDPSINEVDFCGLDSIIFSTGYAYDENAEIIYANLDNYNEVVLEEWGGRVMASPDGKYTFTFTGNGVKAYDNNAKLVYQIDFKDYNITLNEFSEFSNIVFSPDGQFLTFAFQASAVETYYDIFQFSIETGEITFHSVFDEDVYSMEMVTSNDSLYLSYYSDDERNGLVSKIVEYDIKSGKIKKETETKDGNSGRITLLDNGICITDYNILALYDYDLNYVLSYKREQSIMDVFDYNDSIAVIDSSGSIYLVDDYNSEGMDITASVFNKKKSSQILNFKSKDSAFYIQYMDNDSYISVYSPNSNSVLNNDYLFNEENFDTFEYGYEDLPIEYYFLDTDNISWVIKSDDDKYTAIQTYDGAFCIYDNSNQKEVRTLYLNAYPERFGYLKKYDCYIISAYMDNYLFDKNFKFFTDIPNSYCYGTDKESGDLVFSNDNGEYSIELLSYGEVLKKADEILNGYVPDKKILDKYNITVK